MSIRFSHSPFPCSPAQKEQCGLPWGLVLQPLAPLAHPSASTSEASTSVARCSTCLAYINPYATFVRRGWKCALCRSTNSFATRRYDSQEERMRLPELVLPDVEYRWVEEDPVAQAADEAAAQRRAKAIANGEVLEEDEDSLAEAAAVAAYEASRDPSAESYDPSATLVQPFSAGPSASSSPPAYVLLVDLSADPARLELVKSALLAALEALPPSVWVGLAVVAGRVGLYDLKCAVPTVAYASVRSSAAACASGAASLDESPTSLPLHLLLPLDSFLQKLQHCKENLAVAIESLVSHAPRADLDELRRQAGAGADSQLDPEAGGGDDRDTEGGESSTPSADTGAAAAASAASRTNPFGFGGAMSALLSYISAVEEQGLELNVRLLCFLTQRPNWGLGALPDRGESARDEEGNPQDLSVDDLDRWSFRPFEGRMAPSGGGGGAGSGGAAAASSSSSVGSNVSTRLCGDFYRELGSSASQRGVCIDLYVLASAPTQHVDLATLKYLSLLTGGNLLYYPSARDCALPQDLFRQLRLGQAWRCMIRVRCSPPLHASNVYGHLVADESIEGLFHVGGCDARKSFAVDLDFVSNEGFRGGYVDVTPVIQVAFSYIGLFPSPDSGAGGGMRVEHRLRVLTRQVPLVLYPSLSSFPSGTSKAVREALLAKASRQASAELFAASAPEVILTLLVQQLIHASLERGLTEARMLLREWLVGFMCAYHDVHGSKKSAAPPAAGASASGAPGDSGAAESEPLTIESLDLGLSLAPRLQFLPRFVCALLKSPLLSAGSLGGGGSSSGPRGPRGPDERVYVQVLYSGLEADYLVKSVYPTLSSYSLSFDPRLSASSGPDADAVARMSLAQRQSLVRIDSHHPVLYLTRFSLSGCGDFVFLLDSCAEMRVLYAPGAADSPQARAGLLPLPPPAHTELAKTVKRIKAATPYLTPRVLYCADADPDAAASSAYQPSVLAGGKDSLRHFHAALLEDDEGGPGAFSFQTLLQEVGREVVRRLNGEDE